MESGDRRNVIFICLAQFGFAFSGNFVYAMMPFYISKVTPYSPQETLLWVGSIMGATHFVTMVAATYWGILTSRFSPKLLYLRGMVGNVILFCAMGFTSSLPALLVLRILQGAMSGISTIGLIMISSSSPHERVSADLGLLQTSMTLGQLVGPPIGAFAASAFGYRGAFVSASAALLTMAAFCFFNVKDVPSKPAREKFFGRKTINQRTLVAWMLGFVATLQLMFLPSILPNVLDQLKLEKDIALRWSGTIIMLYTATSTLGTFFWTHLSTRLGKEKMLIFLVLSGALFQAFLALTHGLTDFIVIRMIQTGLIAATLPLVISLFATELRGSTIGFLNSSRFAANASGPLLATSVLAASNLATVYLLISGLTLVGLVGFSVTFKKPSPRKSL